MSSTVLSSIQQYTRIFLRENHHKTSSKNARHWVFEKCLCLEPTNEIQTVAKFPMSERDTAQINWSSEEDAEVRYLNYTTLQLNPTLTASKLMMSSRASITVRLDQRCNWSQHKKINVVAEKIGCGNEPKSLRKIGLIKKMIYSEIS